MTRGKKVVLGLLAAVNIAVLGMSVAATPASAETYMGDGYCNLCVGPDGSAMWCCVLYSCGNSGQPACTCHNAGGCPS